MKFLTLFVLLCSHLPFVWFCLRALRNHEMPTSADTVIVSILVYFDLEIIFEIFGGRFVHAVGYFRPFFSASDSSLSLAVFFLASAPWLIKFGSWLIESFPHQTAKRTRLRIRHWRLFYSLSIALCILTAATSIRFLLNYAAMWAAHAEVVDAFGPTLILFYLPMCILGFYVFQPEARTRFGKFFTVFLVVFSILSTLALVERTLALIPILIAAGFYGRLSLRRVTLSAVCLLTVAVLMVPIYKNEFKSADFSESVASVFTGDLARGPQLIESIEASNVIGTKILPFTGCGYVFSAFMYVPRSIAPWKCLPTNRFLTQHVIARRALDLDWGLGVGAIDESILNFGYVGFLPVMLVYGIFFGLLDRLALKFPVLTISSRLASVWLMGYDLPALITTFGVIAFVGILLQLVLCKREKIVTVRLIESRAN